MAAYIIAASCLFWEKLIERGSPEVCVFGCADAELQFVLEKHPKLLLFSQEGSVLAMGRARAQVNKDGAGRVGVQMYREGAFLRGLTTKK